MKMSVTVFHASRHNRDTALEPQDDGSSASLELTGTLERTIIEMSRIAMRIESITMMQDFREGHCINGYHGNDDCTFCVKPPLNEGAT